MYQTYEYQPHLSRHYVDTDFKHSYVVDDSPYPYLNGYSLPGEGRRKGEVLYGEALTDLCKDTRNNIYRLRETLTKVDPCYQYGEQHWHFNQEKKEPEVELPENMRPKWADTQTMFTTRNVMDRTMWSRPHSGETDKEQPGPVNKYCYICTTLEEHQQHLARRGRQLKAKDVPHPRVGFIVPVPKTRKVVDSTDRVHECLYRISIKTGNKPNAATSANVMIKLKGKAGTMKPQKLSKKTCVNFTFGRGTLETFYIKTPKLGPLRSLTISHDGLERKHSWFVEEIEVFDVSVKQLYTFRCRQWLSLYEGEQTVKMELRARAVEKTREEYEIRVTTGNKALAGTDAHVSLTLCGKLGYSSKLKLNRETKKGDTLERGKTDFFTMITDDIGPLQRIRIEHDNKGRSPDWLLEKIEVEGGAEGRPLLFPCGRWIPNDEEQDRAKITVDLYPVKSLGALKKLMKYDDEKIPQVKYHVTVVTGEKWGAGTDANVYIMFIGKKQQSRDVQLDDEKNNFEKGMVDNFKIKGDDVGPIRKIKIRHDDTSLAAGWFLDKVIVKRFFSDEERAARLAEEGMEEDERALRRASSITGKTLKGKDIDRDEKKKKSRRKGKSDSDEDSDEDEYTKMKKKRDRLKEKGRLSSSHNRRRGKSESDEEDSDEDKKKKKKKDRKKRFSLLGSSSDSDSDDEKKKGKKKKKKADSDSDDDKKKKKKDSKKKGLFNFNLFSSDSSDSDSKKSKKKGKKSSLRDKKKDSDSEDDEKRRKKRAGKKKFSYGGIDTWVTESESEDDKRSKKKGKKMKDEDYDEIDGKRRGKKKDRKYKNSSSDSSDSSDSNSDSSSESDDDGGRKKQKKKKGNIEKGRRQKGQVSSSESDGEYKGRVYKNMAEDRIPLFDEYEFICRRWLATDEDDGKIERYLKPQAITKFYRKT